MDNALGYLGFSAQPDETTDEAPAFFVPWQTLTAPETIQMALHRNGFTPDLSIARKIGQYTDYTFKTFLSPDAGAALLCYTLGGIDTVTPGSPNLHSFGIADTQPPFLSIESGMGDGTIVQRIPGCRIQKSVIKCTGGQLVEYDATIRGRQAIHQASAASVVFEDEDDILSFLDGALVFTGLDVDDFDVTELSIEIDNTITPRRTVGQFAPRYLREARQIKLMFKVLAPDDQLFREVNWDSASGTGPLTATKYLTSLVSTFAIAADSHQVAVTNNNVAMHKGASNWDVNAGAWIVDCEGTAIRAGSSMCDVAASNANASAYLS